jgi:threonine/homoserine/homoserine lactone efflux protein
MVDLLPPVPLLAAFVMASLLLALTPGPGVLYIVMRSLIQGRRAGLTSVAGVALGNLANALGAALGLAALFAVSSTAFVIVKYAGAAYLVFLGIRALCRASAVTADVNAGPGRSRHVFRDGFFVALLNPKTTLFFAAFLPQFMGSDANPMIQGVTLGMLFVAIAGVTDAIYAVTAGAVSSALQDAHGLRRAGRYLSAGTFIGLGVFAALTDARSRQ